MVLREIYHWKNLSITWRNLSKDIAKNGKNCFNKVKSSTRGTMAITPTPQNLFDVIVIDTIGPLDKSDTKKIKKHKQTSKQKL